MLERVGLSAAEPKPLAHSEGNVWFFALERLFFFFYLFI